MSKTDEIIRQILSDRIQVPKPFTLKDEIVLKFWEPDYDAEAVVTEIITAVEFYRSQNNNADTDIQTGKNNQ